MEVMYAASKKMGDELFVYYVGANDIKRYVKPKFKPYFFVRETDSERLKKIAQVKKVNVDVDTGDFLSLQGDKLVKVSVDYPFQVSLLRSFLEKGGFQTFESDIPFFKRWMLDEKNTLPTSFSTCYVDAEVDSRKGFPDARVAESRVISIALVDDRGKQFFFSDIDETKILRDFVEQLQNYTVVTGWNIQGWDLPYLQKRVANLGLKLDFRLGHQWVDLMRLYQFATFNDKPSYALDNVAQDELGMRKTENFWTLKRAATLWEAFEKRQDLLRNYNIGDAELVARLDKKRDLISGAVHLINRLGTMFLEDFQYMSRGVTALILSEASSRIPRPVFPRRPIVSPDDKYDSYTGAYIMEPEVGLHRPVIEMDFQSFYPTTFQTFRISPENIAKDKDVFVKTAKLNFKKGDSDPLYTTILNRMTAVTYKLKDEMMNSKDIKIETMHHYSKLYSVSFYGTQGNHKLRIFSKDIAESCTLTCQDILKKTIEFAKEYGLLATYCHTDGTYEKAIFSKVSDFNWLFNYLPKLEKELNAKIKEYVLSEYQVDEKDYKIYLEIKNVFEWLYLMKKNRLKGKRIWDGYNRLEGAETDFSKGIEKSDMFKLLNEVRTTAFNILVRHADSQKEFEWEVTKYMMRLRRRLFKGELCDKLVINMHANKALATYKNITPHVRAAQKLSKQSLFRVGDVISFVVVRRDEKGYLDAEPVVDKLPKILLSGYEYYWERIENVVEEILGRQVNARDERLSQYA